MAAKNARSRNRRSGRPQGRAAARPRPVASPAVSPLRRRIEDVSLPVLHWLSGLPRWLVPLVIAALLLVGLFFSGPGSAAALAAVTAFFVWMSYLSWRAVGALGRLARLGTIAILAGLTVWHILR